jgi:membrane-associated phospholipid phosphatase
MVAYSQFFVAYSVSIALAVCLGLYLMAGSLRTLLKPSVAFLKKHYLLVVVLFTLPLMVQLLSVAKTYVFGPYGSPASVENARLVYELGGGIINDLQRSVESAFVVGGFEVTYMWVFAFFTYFLPLLLIAKRDGRTLTMFTIAVAINYAVLISSYIFFPVKVSSGLPGAGIEPVLYTSHTWGAMATSVDSLTNCFPSGHVSLSFTAFFVFALVGGEYKRLSYTLGATGVVLAFAVLLLGIHYPADVIGGIVLAVVATVASANERTRGTILRAVRSLRIAFEKKAVNQG